MLKTAAPPERSTSDRLEVGDGEGGDSVGGSGGKPPHYWIQLDHSRCRSQERWGLATMKMLAVVVIIH